MVDFLGREIHVGDTIIYPGRRGSNMWLNRATVQTTQEGYRKYAFGTPTGLITAKREGNARQVQITNPERVVVVA
jgi:hypothetical protein